MPTLPIPPGSSGAALTNPMTTAGDIIDGAAGGTPQRIAIGAVGQVLSPSSTTVLAWRDDTKLIGVTFDGGGSALSAGKIIYLYVPYACTIQSVTMLADQSGSAVVDIWKVAYASYPPLVANTIVASDKPTITTAIKSQDTTLTGWTLSIAAGDTLAFHLDSDTTITWLNISLKVAHA